MNDYVKLFCEAVEKFAGETALVDRSGTRKTDYRTFGDLMRRTAAWVYAKGLKEHSFIPVRFESSAEFVSAVCGVWLAGHAAVPMGISFPDERVRFIRENCEAPFIIDDSVIDEIRGTEPLEDSVYPDGDMEDTAFLLYTSGSTGMPKGILHTFAGLLANRNMGKPPVYSTGQRWAMGAPMYFVASVAVYKVLTYGGCVHLLDSETMRDVRKLEDYYEEHSITVGFISPSVLSNFNNRAASLKLVMTGSERLTGQCSRDGYKLYNNYGMSETMGTICSFLVEKPFETTPVGIPPEGSVWALLGDNGDPVPDGEEGEMCVKGTYTKGYFKDPEATEKLFRGGWLHTGDILKKLPDGNLVYINRKDWMVKINGQRVEPGEIENVLMTVPGVKKAVVKAVTGADKSVMLCAYYTGEPLDESFIREKLGERLAAYMIPAFYMHLDELPLNANGKIDRKNLPVPDMMSRKTEYVPPENACQRQICNAFGKVLGFSEVGINDDFFSLGGDSIKVMALQRTLREAGIELTANAIFTARTPKEMSEKVTDPSELSVYAGSPADSYPLTNAQLSVYLDCRTPGKETSYNNVFGLFLPADMEPDAEKLRAAAEDILGRYPILSMSVRDVEGVPSLVPSGRKTEVKTENTDITDRAELAGKLNTVFDLENEPLSRACVYVNEQGVFFVCVLHHIVSDGTSVSILANNIAAAYNGETVLPEEMSNLTLAQYEAEKAAELSADAQVYRDMLDFMDGDTELYSDDDPSLRSMAGKLGVYNTTVSDIPTARLSENNITEASLFMSAYAYMLRLFCNQKNVLFFTGENGRHDPVLQNTVGMMVHNIPVLSAIDDNDACMTFISGMQSRFHELTTHDSADFAGLCGEYGIHPDCFFVYQGTMLSLVNIGGRNIPMEFYRSDSVMASMTLHVLKKNSTEYELHFEYAADRFTEDTVKRMADVYSRIAAGLCEAETLGEINLVGDEALMLMDEANSDEKDYPVTDIVSLFRAQAAKTPDNTAVIFKDETYTYSQIDEISERIAGKLRSSGIGHGDVVSILIPRCSYMTTASLGVLKSGAAYQPLDPSYPIERLEFMMNDADCKLLIADEKLLSRVPGYKGKILLTKDIPGLPVCEKITDTPAPDDLFILLYTSGSTGTPKGVMLEHRNLVNFCAWYREFYHLDASSRVAAYASYGFDANMMDQYPALTTGSCVCIIEDEIRLDLLAMEAWINRLGITHAFMTTQVGRQFYSLANVEKLKYLSTGGEKLVPLPPKNGAEKFYNLYGPTECTIVTTRKHVDRLYERVPIGRALTNYKCYVVDANLRRLPPLVPGELLVSGRGVARGYLNRPDLTEKAFIKNPFCDKEGFERAYRSGDIVRLLPNGDIDFIGRNDGQVKVRGFRIELTEVEGVIREFPGITDATVQAFEDESSGEKFIAAYVVSPEPVDISAMNEFIMERKPPYMVPAVTMQIGRIPLNQNQKVNKKELPKPQRRKVEVIPPQTETQQKIFDCVAEVVGHKDFGITTNIYEAGLSSIGAIRLNVLLSKAFDKAVSTRDLKENNTIDKLETFLTGTDNKLPVFEVQSEYGLSKTQEGIYVECVAKPDDTVYNIPILLEISSEIDTAKLKTAIVEAVNAHPLLKARLFLNDDGDVRMRRMDGDFSFDESCINERDISSIDDEKTQLVKPFRLLGGRLFRAEILHGEKTYLFIEMHHIVSDGSSMMIFLNDVSAAYAGKTPEKETYTGYEAVLNEETLRAGDAFTNAKSYYENLLDGAETQSLPAGDIRGDDKPRTASFDFASDKVTPEAAKQWCEKNGASMNGLFSAAFGLTLNKFLGTESAAFAGIYSGRSDSRLAGTVAMLVKTIPIVSALGSGKTVVQYVREMSRQLIDSQSNDIYSFAEMSRALNVNADVMFAWQGDEFIFSSLCGLPAKLIPVELSEAKAPINMNVWIVGGKLRFITEYRADKFSEDYIRGFSEALETALYGILHCEWLTQVSVMSDNARRLLDSFNATDVPIPHTTCNRLFEEQVRQHPDKTAVIADGESLTYTQLNENANRIANALISQGVRPDDMVGVMMPRKVWAYAVREGVLKAGGAYMPLAPDYPDDRVEYIICNSGSKTLVTTEATAAEREALFSRLGIAVCTVEELLKHENTENPDPGITPDNLCYCIYTSGSTGKPKGVMIEHHSLVNFVNHNPVNLQSCEFVDNMTVSLALAALTFDVSVLEETLGLYHGGTVAMATDEEINNPLLLCEMMRKTGVDVMKCTPSYMNNLLDFKETWEVLRQMKAIDIGAEAFPAPLYKKMRAAGITAKIHNGYGPTETTITASMDIVNDTHITIGKPLCNIKIVMLDKYGNELPPDAPGELTIVGECVGRGYVANEKLTAEKFIKWKGAPAYRSGDMARWDRNGKINFIGRSDNQVKLHGLRIELDEIENVMNTYPSVLRSVVLVKTSEKGEQFLCAWFTANETVDHSDLKAHISKSLAKYMVPSVFVQLNAIPLTQNGKVDKKALPDPGTARIGEGKPATTPLQKQIAEMFAKALGMETVGIDEDFFEIGGTSMLASKVAMQAMIAKLPIAYKDIFANPTVEALELHVLSSGGNHAAAAADINTGETESLEPEEIRPALEYNSMAHIREITAEPAGNVLLTGATGFLGIHVLHELLESSTGKITCFVRKGQSETARKRLESMLVYYFENNYASEFDSGRLRAVDGDITDRGIVLAQDGISFDTVINCAACVKHFANDDILDRVNVKGVENLIALCEKTGARLVQISTVSVAGENVNHALPDTLRMFENMLWFGQDLSNQYVRSKFDAEKAVLSHIAAGKLRAKVIRVGNLMSRDTDGEFQANYVTSGFMRNLKGYAAIGAFPVSAMAGAVEFSPIDLVAKAVCLLAGTPDKFTVFHAVNGHWIEMGDVIAAMNAAGLPVEVVDEQEFSKRLSEALKDDEKNMLVSGLISYLSSDAGTVRSYVEEDHTFTKNALYRLGYRWPLTDERYLTGAVEALISLGFFDSDNP